MAEQHSVISVQELVDYFDYTVLCGDEEALKKRQISIADTNRPGLELAGYFHYTQRKRIVVLGDKEIEYIKTMDIKSQTIAFDFLTSYDTPLIIISNSHECPSELLKIAKAKNFPIIRSKLPTSRMVINMVSFLDEKLAKSDALHGDLMSIFGKGVLIRGESGSGKSEVALDLIRRGHQLVSDDLVDCYQVHNRIIGKAPEILNGFLELRGIGIVNVNKMYGATATLPKANIDFVVELRQWDAKFDYDRVGIEETKYEEILDVQIPKIILPIRGGRTMANLIESAITNIVLKEEGYDSAKDFEKRCLDQIAGQQEEQEGEAK